MDLHLGFNRLWPAFQALTWAIALLILGGLGGCSGGTVQFPSLDQAADGSGKVQLKARMLKPEGAGPFPAVVLLHGCGGMYTASGIVARDDSWARLLQERGYVTLNVDSFNPRGVREVCTKNPSPVRPDVNRSRDAYGALAWLQAQSFVEADRIAVMGWSNGGSTVVYTVDATHPVRPNSSTPDFRAAVSFYPACGNAMRRGWTTKVPTLLLLGESDDWDPPLPCRDMAEQTHAAGAPVSYVLYPNANHDFDAPGSGIQMRTGISSQSGTAVLGPNPEARADALKRVPEFLATWLKGR